MYGVDDRLKSIRTEINRLRRIERGIIKADQQYCPHRKVKRVIKQGSVNVFSNPNVLFSSSASYKTKIVCEDCFKVLSK